MNYTESYWKLQSICTSSNEAFEFSNFTVQKFNFSSNFYGLLPGNENYFCKDHKLSFENTISYENNIESTNDEVHINDVLIEENKQFQYFILLPKGVKKASKLTFLFHGLNEKSWDKYLPWAEYICNNTKTAVVLFPIAFHMDRAPLLWAEKRKMFELSEKRKKQFPHIINSTLSNVAISMRLHTMPQRLIWSGLQTYYDVIDFIEMVKNGNHSVIAKDFTFDIFAYSIGGLLAEILKLANHNNYFTNSKLCLFCGGAVMNRFSAVSKFILDSEANISLYSYLAEHFDSFLKKDAVLNHYIEGDHFEGKVFHSMLEYQKMRLFREELFKNYQNQIYAVTLRKDYVIPSFEVINTLQGAFRDISIKVDEFDFDYPYSHENPFPLNKNYSEQVNSNFKLVFSKVVNFFNS